MMQLAARQIAHRSLPGLVLQLLVAGAIVAAWVAGVVMAESGEDANLLEAASRPALYYAAHGLAIVCTLTAGLLSLAAGRASLVGPGTRLAFLILAAAAVIWAVAAYDPQEIASARILGATGPFVWLSLVLVFAGADRANWRMADPAIRILTYVTAALALRTILDGADAGYIAGLSKSTQYASLLFWVGGWTLLSAAQCHGRKLLAPAIPYFVLVAISIHSQARSWTLLAGLLGITFLVLHAREMKSPVALLRAGAAALLLAGIAGTVLYVATPVGASIDGLMERMDEDTRSGQYVDFFADVEASELVLGRGPKGTWYWTVAGDYQFFDNGFLWMLFIGGVPIFIPYLTIVFVPALRSMTAFPRALDAVPVAMVLFWGVCLTGLSTFTLPSLGFSSYLVSLCAGRCHRLIWEARMNRVARDYAPVRTPGQIALSELT